MSRNTARARTGQEERRRAAETGEDAPAIPFLKRFTVFNTDQCDGLPGDIAKAASNWRRASRCAPCCKA